MKATFHKFFSSLGTFVLGLFGFASCDGSFIDGPVICEYGTPNCDFKVDVTVVDESGKALEGIKVIPGGVANPGGGRSQQDVAMLFGNSLFIEKAIAFLRMTDSCHGTVKEDFMKLLEGDCIESRSYSIS